MQRILLETGSSKPVTARFESNAEGNLQFKNECFGSFYNN